ncbi:unnamed protein product [Cylicocyclus nassatus]|uniref:Uncharacterized protein n=1 Tax=Cylicocyclus nassatus TaxID=53992 RepID=A0AA36GKP7_CYLNA|nr:unnamed protein product [Cylicocyclus nassatus]
MNIRYEELCDDIFGADDEFLSMFEKEASNAEDKERSFTQPGALHAGIQSNYAVVCMESKLTEVGLRYVDKMYEQIKQKNAEVEKCRSLIAQHNADITSITSELISIHEELGSLASVVDTVIGVSPSEYSRTSMTKTRSA